jgi:hypothetical protein
MRAKRCGPHLHQLSFLQSRPRETTAMSEQVRVKELERCNMILRELEKIKEVI